MKIQYIITKEEIDSAKNRLKELRKAAIMSRDVGEVEDSREFYLKAKGFEEALVILGIFKEGKNEAKKN